MDIRIRDMGSLCNECAFQVLADTGRKRDRDAQRHEVCREPAVTRRVRRPQKSRVPGGLLRNARRLRYQRGTGGSPRGVHGIKRIGTPEVDHAA